MNVALSGSTGLVGSHLLRLLCEEPPVAHLYAVGRREPEWAHAKVTFISSAQGTSANLPSIDAAFCCLGTTIKKAGSQAAFRAVDFDMVVHFAKSAKAAGAQSFGLVSALGANAQSSVFYNRVKGETEEALLAQGFQSLVIARPSFLMGDRAESRPGERLGIAVSRMMSPLMIGPAKRLRPVAAEAVARTLVEATLHPQPGVRIIESEHLA
ncbi:MAG: oxidoreductase [Betaproteobacteria bacterium]|nr:oxidoreductase [Betaproteobacteria bacterium]